MTAQPDVSSPGSNFDTNSTSDDPSTSELKKRILTLFSVFDYGKNRTVDVSEVRTIIASLSLFPTQTELHDMIAEMEDDEPTGYISYEKFEPVVFRNLTEKRYMNASEETLLKAFEALDHEKKGYLSREEISRYLSEEGESFSKDEIDEFLHASINVKTGQIDYKDFVQFMLEQDSNII